MVLDIKMNDDMNDFISHEQSIRDESIQHPPNSMSELKSRLSQLGKEWVNEHSPCDAKGNIKPIHLQPRIVADILKSECTFIIIDEDNPELSPLAVYDIDNGIYENGERFIDKLSMSVERNLTSYECKNVRHYLTIESEQRSKTCDHNLIVVNNGIFDKKEEKLKPFDSKYVFINKIETNYVPDAIEPIFEDWTFSEWIKEISDGNPLKEELIWQLFSLTVDSNFISEVAFFFLSESGKTGKSTFEQLLINIVGKRNYASLKIKEFEKSFLLAQSYGKTLLIGDDNNPKDFNETSEQFKSVVTGDPILINPKGKSPFTTMLTPLVVQSMNGLPRFKDITDGMLRRIRVIRFNHTYKGKNGNRRIKEQYIKSEELHEFIVSRAIRIKFDEVVDTEESKLSIHELQIDNSPILEFYESEFKSLVSTRLPTKFLFKLFQCWCDIENIPTKIKQLTFTRELRLLAEKDGWEYYRNTKRPMEYFRGTDESRLESLDKNGHYSISYGHNVVQPLLEYTDSINIDK